MRSGKNIKSMGLPKRRKETISRRQERETISGYIRGDIGLGRS